METSNVMKSRLVYADIFIYTGSKPNAFNLRQAKEKKKWGNVKSVCDQKRNSYGIYKKHFVQYVYT